MRWPKFDAIARSSGACAHLVKAQHVARANVIADALSRIPSTYFHRPQAVLLLVNFFSGLANFSQWIAITKDRRR